MLKKSLVCGIIVLFFGISIIPIAENLSAEKYAPITGLGKELHTIMKTVTPLTEGKTLNFFNPSSAEDIIVDVSLSESSVLGKLLDHRITILGIDKSRTSAKLLVSSAELRWLDDMGLSPEILDQNLAQMDGWQNDSRGLLDFHNYNQMTTELQNIAATYPSITQLYDLGHSVQGRVLWGLKITDNLDIEEDEPEVRICGLHHGNEYMGAEVPISLAQYLTQNYGSDPIITNLVDNREIWIIPMVNPDGREAGTRDNANGVDLNRDYGYMWEAGWGSPSPFSQPETQAMRMNALENNFVLSLSFHTSGDIINYIWNYKHQSVPDNAAVVFLSQQYGSHNSYWVTDGYDWYQTRGDTNDFSYGCRGDIDWTIEVQSSNIPQCWDLNRAAMLEIIDEANMGLRGIVTDANTGLPIAATVWVDQAYWPCFNDPQIGDYHRILLPGTYTVHFRANGYAEKTFNVQINSGGPTILNVALSPGNEHYAYQVTMCNFYDPMNYPNNFQNNPTEAISLLGPPDGVCASLGVGGMIVLDTGEDIVDIADAPDFKIFEGGTSDGYRVYVSSNWNGPWVDMGPVMGTAELDLADVSVESARYVKIVDDGNGNPSETNPGADIDAIQNLAAGNAPNIPSKPDGPTTGVVNVEYTYSTTTTDPNGDQIYYMFSWGDGTDSGWIGPFDSGVTAAASHTWSSSGDYEIRVKAKDTNGVESGWSEPLIMTILDNNLPNAPDILGPSKGKPGTTYKYTITATDPDQDDLYYYVDWGDTTNSGWIGPYASGANVNINHAWSVKGSYTIQAKAKDTHGGESDWGTLDVSMPRFKLSTHGLLLRLLEQFPNAFPILRHILKL